MLAFTNQIQISQKPKTWRAKARCNDGAATATALFFSDDLLDIARAKAICAKCTVSARRGRALGCLGRGAHLERSRRRPQAQTGTTT